MVSRLKATTSFVDIAILRFLLFAFVKAFQDRRAPWYQRGLVEAPRRSEGAKERDQIALFIAGQFRAEH